MSKGLERKIEQYSHYQEENQMFGISQQQMEQMFANNYYSKLMGKNAGGLMLAMSILSDAQEILQDQNNSVRQQINQAKFVIAEVMDQVYVRVLEKS